MRVLLLLIFVGSFCSLGTSQISFTESTNLIPEGPHFSGVAIGVTDMNGDGLDDIVRLSEGYHLNIQYQNATGFNSKNYEAVGNDSQWSMCIGDLANDGFPDILTGGYYEDIELIFFDGDIENSTIDYLPEGKNVFVQATNMADINNDGYLDIFACHDDGANYVWLNNTDGTFYRDENIIDFAINGSNEEWAAGNYGSVWADVDSDGDTDLYIAKCRQGVVDTNDVRRINQLYINNGDGTYTEDAADRGLAIAWQSWTADFQDINNDGHLDCFVTNHDHPAQLLINDGTGYFEELEESGINVSGLPVQSIMRDFDNDGWIDVLVAGSLGQYFKNNGDSTFTEIVNLFGVDPLESFALGDLNNDGYVDIYGGYATIFTTPSSIPDKLWLNDGAENNYIAISLIGVESNRNGIGAKVTIHGPWGVQIRDVRAGESYGISNSQTMYFGLGTVEQVDSIVVNWPSGHVQTETDIAADSKIKILEGGCLADSPTIFAEGLTTFCTGEEVVLTAPDGLNSYLWSNGETTKSITVTTQNVYSFQTTNDEGCLGFSNNIVVTVDPKLEPKIDVENQISFCEGESISLTQIATIGDVPLMWNTGETTQSITVSESGIYFVQAQGLCDSYMSEEIEVTVFPTPPPPITTDINIEQGEVATLTAQGMNIAWYRSAFEDNAIGYGASIDIEGLTSDTIFYAEDRSGTGDINRLGPEDHKGTLYAPNPDDSNGLIFNALQPFTLDSVKVYTDQAGERKILLSVNIFEVIQEKTVFIEEGESTIHLGFDVPAGFDLSLRTDANTNKVNFDTFGPRLQRSDTDVNFPYEVEDVIKLRQSLNGNVFYYYFYDWKISYGDLCPGERSPLHVTVGSVSSEEIHNNSFVIFPNPTANLATIKFDELSSSQKEISVINTSGKVVKNLISNEEVITLDLHDIPSDNYIVKVKSDSGILFEKLAITK